MIKTKARDRKFIDSVPLPNWGGQYSVIPHGKMIDEIENNIQKEGLNVSQETFITTFNGKVINGHITLNNFNDADLQCEIAFVNSYDKTRRAIIACGSSVIICGNGHILGDTKYGFLKRKHIGDAAEEVFKFIPELIKNTADTFEKLRKQKEVMKEIEISKRTIATLIGDLYLNEQIITDTQMAIIRREIDNPSFDYGAEKNSLWTIYNDVTFALKQSHPSKWIQNHQVLNNLVSQEFELDIV